MNSEFSHRLVKPSSASMNSISIFLPPKESSSLPSAKEEVLFHSKILPVYEEVKLVMIYAHTCLTFQSDLETITTIRA